GAAARVDATAVARPFETYEGAAASYGEVPFQGGVLRDIYVAPANAPKDGPVVYFIQGVFCGSVEGPTPEHPVRAFLQGLAERGIASYRVEKPGMGDSAGPVECKDADFATELAAFRAGLDALVKTRKIAPSRIVLFGHSMGGVEAPLLAAERAGQLRGIATMGTVLRPWRDYLGEVFWIQGFLSSNADPVESTEAGLAMRGLLDRIFIDKASLATIAAGDPAEAQRLKDDLGWDGKNNFMGRSAPYWTGVNDQKLPRAWRDAKAPVLALYGESDFAAIDDRDHRLIVDIVNHYRPGTARYVLLEKTGHPLTLDGTRAEAAAKNEKAGGATGAPLGPYNKDMTRIVADWIVALPAPARSR
ncbi:MAG: alpha/beta hydrolase, partial [Parvularculaceae bacterium]|nr:alpha/beta hydrolase [Parvularculaceae bacterium]